MSIEEAVQHISRPPRFGDAEQIKALAMIDAVERNMNYDCPDELSSDLMIAIMHVRRYGWPECR